MVDGLSAIDETSVTSRLILSPDNLFCKDGFFHEAGLLENMAQTAALKSSYEAMINNELPQVGFIGSVKHFKIYKLPKDTLTLSTTVRIETRIANATIIKGEVKTGDELLAEGEMSIFNQE